MDISTIKSPVEKTEAEPHAGVPDGSESAFLQLLANLGFTQPSPDDAGRGSLVNDGASVQTEPLPIDTEALARALAANGLQEKIVAVEDATGGGTPDGIKAQALLAQVITSAGKTGSDSTGTALAQALSIGTKDMPAKDQVVAAEGKPGTALPSAKGPAESLPPTTSKDASQAGSTRLMEVLFSGHVVKERGSASPASAASTSLTPNVASQLAMSLETPAKQTAITASSLAVTMGLELSALQQFGTQDNPASAEHDGSKERFTQAESDGGQPTLTSVISSSSSLSVSPSGRTASPTAMEAPTVVAHPESPMPASVRFEVQPGDMGRIRVHLSVVDHTVYTNVMTERVDTHDFLVRNSERFEAGLGAHGLEVGRFQVDVHSEARQHGDRGWTGWLQDDVPRRNSQSSEQPMVDWHASHRDPGSMDRMINVFA
jgi:hypothetical protein